MKFYKIIAPVAAFAMAVTPVSAQNGKQNAGHDYSIRTAAGEFNNVISYLNKDGAFWDYKGNGEGLDAAAVGFVLTRKGKTVSTKRTVMASDVYKAMKENPEKFRQLRISLLDDEILPLDRDSLEFKRIEELYHRAKENAPQAFKDYIK